MTESPALPAGALQLWRAPDGLTLHCLNPNETRALYQEIFVDRCYAPAGMRPPDGSTIVDVGANIGVFSLFSAGEWPSCPIVAVEAVPALGQVCRCNLSGHTAQVIEAACTDVSGFVDLIYYPDYSILSGRHAEPQVDLDATAAVLRASGQVPADVDDEDLAELLELKLRGAVQLQVRSQTLDSIVEMTCGRGPIGLVKVDVEGDELTVLAGGSATIRRAANVIVEVSGAARARQVIRILEASGLTVETYQSPEYQGSELMLAWGQRS